MNLHYTKLTPTAFAATTAADGFPALNLGSSALGRPWKATGNGATDLVLTLFAATAVKTLELHDVNFATAQVYKSADGVVFNLVGTLTSYAGRENRRRGLIVINDANVKAIKVSIGAGAGTDALPWRCGAAHIFAASIVVPSPFQNDYSIKLIVGQVRTELANKQPATARTGIDFHVMSVPFKPVDTEDLGPTLALARAGTVLVELGLANYPWQVWPARWIEDELAERFGLPKMSEMDLVFTEVV